MRLSNGGRGFESRLVPTIFSEYHLIFTVRFSVKEIHRDETCIQLRRNSKVHVKSPARTGPAWGLLPVLSSMRGGLCPAVGRIQADLLLLFIIHQLADQHILELPALPFHDIIKYL
jgi:hypothetical protein